MSMYAGTGGSVGHRDVEDVHVLPPDQVQQQVQRPLECSRKTSSASGGIYRSSGMSCSGSPRTTASGISCCCGNGLNTAACIAALPDSTLKSAVSGMATEFVASWSVHRSGWALHGKADQSSVIESARQALKIVTSRRGRLGGFKRAHGLAE